jgi:hypothetical protein
LAETFNVSSYYNNTQLIGIQQVSLLAPSAYITVSFRMEHAKGSVPQPLDNELLQHTSLRHKRDKQHFSVSNVTVRIKGDVNGDCKVDISDVI